MIHIRNLHDYHLIIHNPELQREVVNYLQYYTITVRDITNFNSKEKERNTAVTANHYLILIRRMFNLAIQCELVEKNPAGGLDKFKTPPNRERYLTKEELQRFLRALDEMEDRLSMVAIKLLLFAGCRKGEILSLQWSQVKLDEGRLFLPVTKNGQSRSVVLNNKPKDVLGVLATSKDGDIRIKNRLYLAKFCTVRRRNATPASPASVIV